MRSALKSRFFGGLPGKTMRNLASLTLNCSYLS